MTRTSTPAPDTARSAAGTATDPAPAPVAPAAGVSPAAAVLAALSAEPSGAAVAVIAGHAGITVAAARQALIAHEKTGTATRVKGGRPGIADTWKPAAGEAAPGPDPEPDGRPGAAGTGPATPQDQAPGTDATAEPAAEGSSGAADAGQPVPAPGSGTATEGEAEAGTAPGPDPAAAAEAAGSALALEQAAGDACKALAAGDLDAALTALDAAREHAAQARRVIKAAASGKHAPATRPGGLRDLVEAHLRTFPGGAFTPHQVGKVLTRSSGAVANALDKLVSLGVAELACDKPRSYQLAPAAGPDAGAETAATAP